MGQSCSRTQTKNTAKKVSAMFLSLLLLSLSTSLLDAAGPTGFTAGPLPPYMLGKFELETSKGFDDYMYKLGVDWFTRKFACAVWPTAQNNHTKDGRIKIDTYSSLKSTSVTFKLNEPFQEDTADGRTVTTTTVLDLENGRLIKTQVGNPTRIEIRQFYKGKDGEERMKLTHTMPSDKSIKSERVYKRNKNKSRRK